MAVAHRGGCPFSDKAERVAAAGAVALIVINAEDQHKVPGLVYDCSIPVLIVRSRDAEALASATEISLTIEVQEQPPTEGVPPAGALEQLIEGVPSFTATE